MGRRKKEHNEEAIAQRGQRLRSLREAANLTRPQFGTPIGVGREAVRYWEEGRGTGLNIEAAELAAKSFAMIGIHVSPSWLVFGVGVDPTPFVQEKSDWEPYFIRQELDLFHRQYPDARSLVLSDSSMAPEFLPGDGVAAAIAVKPQEAVGQNCLVELNDGSFYFRYFTKAEHAADQFNLIALNNKITMTVTADIIELVMPISMYRKSIKV